MMADGAGRRPARRRVPDLDLILTCDNFLYEGLQGRACGAPGPSRPTPGSERTTKKICRPKTRSSSRSCGPMPRIVTCVCTWRQGWHSRSLWPLASSSRAATHVRTTGAATGRTSSPDRRPWWVPHGLQFGLQFTRVQHRPRRTDRQRWSRLNGWGRLRPELLMRLGFAPFPDRLAPSVLLGAMAA